MHMNTYVYVYIWKCIHIYAGVSERKSVNIIVKGMKEKCNENENLPWTSLDGIEVKRAE